MKNLFLNIFVIVFVTLVIAPADFASAEWKVDFSRRVKKMRNQEATLPEKKSKPTHVLDMVFDQSIPPQELVILNTKKGFVPETVSVQQGRQYKVTVVNVNESNKNISFVLDSFSEHHSTFYGKIKTFIISPKKDGVYTFQCPETSAQGKLVVYPVRRRSNRALNIRHPASR